MNGLERNTKRLFENGGKLFVAAFDHPQIYGLMEGLEKPLKLIGQLADEGLDGFILNPGLFKLLPCDKMFSKKVIMRASLGGSAFSQFSTCHNVFVSPENALASGADAVLIMLVLGGESDINSMTEVARSIDKYHKFSIPVIVEVIAADFEKTNDSKFVKDGARIAAELGADVVKAFYCEEFFNVIEGCPVPVILAGGPKGEDIRDTARETVKYNVDGFAFGRNIFQSDNPVEIVKDLNAILRG